MQKQIFLRTVANSIRKTKFFEREQFRLDFYEFEKSSLHQRKNFKEDFYGFLRTVAGRLCESTNLYGFSEQLTSNRKSNYFLARVIMDANCKSVFVMNR